MSGKTTTQSTLNAPQASADNETFTEESGFISGTILTYDVMANDLGGAAKRLWSLDDGLAPDGETELTPTQLANALKAGEVNLVTEEGTKASAWEPIAGTDGIRMRINDGKVEIDLAGALEQYGGTVQGLGAGESISATFYYTIRLANGTLSVAKATFTIEGENDDPTITSEPFELSIDEDSTDTIGGQIVATDVDANDELSYSFEGPEDAADYGTFEIDENGNWTFDLDEESDLVQSLAQGETKVLEFEVTVSDGKGGTATQTVKITINGTNDAPTITSSAQSGTVTEDGDDDTVSGQVTATDVDNDDELTYSFEGPGDAADYGTFSINEETGAWEFKLDNTKSAVQALSSDDTKELVFTVTVTDKEGETTTQDVTITINGADEPVTEVTRLDVVTGADPNDNDNLGQTGPQTLNGGSGQTADTLYGGPGNDNLDGKSGNDRLFGGSGNDNLSGSQGNDIIFGGSGADVIDGGPGDDQLTGGFGADNVTGGSGADRFIFISANDRGDIITDFNPSDPDKIVLTEIDANTNVGGNQAFAWGGTTATANGLWYVDNGDGNSTFYADTDGDTSNAELWFIVNGTSFNIGSFDL